MTAQKRPPMCRTGCMFPISPDGTTADVCSGCGAPRIGWDAYRAMLAAEQTAPERTACHICGDSSAHGCAPCMAQDVAEESERRAIRRADRVFQRRLRFYRWMVATGRLTEWTRSDA